MLFNYWKGWPFRLQRYTFILNYQILFKQISYYSFLCLYLKQLQLTCRTFFFPLKLPISYLPPHVKAKLHLRWNKITHTLRQNCVIVRSIVSELLYIYYQTCYIYSAASVIIHLRSRRECYLLTSWEVFPHDVSCIRSRREERINITSRIL